ncbi:kinase-like protein [Polyplosphaeria fusca]|uniref:Kinase-like protein n=1 Tax=Polyplosphaeria fusca TaxID=682080 RepID=A0A9P4V2B6_9PLEO|nr:kinase-like protein [Polyplosphaeria fusca]
MLSPANNDGAREDVTKSALPKPISKPPKPISKPPKPILKPPSESFRVREVGPYFRPLSPLSRRLLPTAVDLNPRGANLLREMLQDLGQQANFTLFAEHDVTDLWLPLPKQSLRYILRDRNAENALFNLQNQILHGRYPHYLNYFEVLSSPHHRFEDGEDFIASEKVLGEGGFAIVEQVTLPTQPKPTSCVRKRIGRSRQLKTQKQLMAAFSREISIMQQISHIHCVKFLGSYTDYENMAIFSSPVADMDLATFLDREHLDTFDLSTLRQGIGCLSSGLLYLHDSKIRHEDLKPQNVLIHGRNFLLTDFGFSLDFSEDSVSTTTGRPSAWTARYSAPETMEHEARNRATDVWGLGCILFEMISAICGRRLSELKAFWRKTGNGHPSFSLNAEALDVFSRKLYADIRSKEDPAKDAALLGLTLGMLQQDRLLRPSVQQIVDKIMDFEMLFPEHNPLIGTCCVKEPNADRAARLLQRWGHLPLQAEYYIPMCSTNFASFVVDSNFNVVDSYDPDDFFGLSYRGITTYPQEPDRLDESPVPTATALLPNLDELLKVLEYLYICEDYAKAPTPPLVVDFEQYSVKRGSPRKEVELSIEKKDSLKNMIQLSAKACSLEHMLSTWLTLPSQPTSEPYVQVSLIPICFPRCELAGQFFYLVSYKINPDEHEESENKYYRWLDGARDDILQTVITDIAHQLGKPSAANEKKSVEANVTALDANVPKEGGDIPEEAIEKDMASQALSSPDASTVDPELNEPSQYVRFDPKPTVYQPEYYYERAATWTNIFPPRKREVFPDEVEFEPEEEEEEEEEEEKEKSPRLGGPLTYTPIIPPSFSARLSQRMTSGAGAASDLT